MKRNDALAGKAETKIAAHVNDPRNARPTQLSPVWFLPESILRAERRRVCIGEHARCGGGHGRRDCGLCRRDGLLGEPVLKQTGVPKCSSFPQSPASAPPR